MQDGEGIVLLDTTIQFHRQDFEHELSAEIEEKLKSFRLVLIPSYCKMEFKSTFLMDLAYLHRKLYQNGSIAGALHYIQKNLGDQPYQKRKFKRTMAHLEMFLRRSERKKLTDRERVDEMLDAMEAFSGLYWDWFDDSVDHVIPATHCIHADKPPIIRGRTVDVSMSPRCKKTNIRCEVHTFFKRNVEKFKSIVAEIEGIPPANQTNEMKNFVALVNDGITDPESICDYSKCRKLGDAIIASHATDEVGHIYSSNYKEYETLCRALGKEFIRQKIRATARED
jgi:hypothetical protein